MDLLRALLSGMSAQRPTHSLFIGGEPLPLETRMGGIFLGFLWGAGFLLFLGRGRAVAPPPRAVTLACVCLIALTGIDGLNAFLSDGRLPHLYEPSTPARLFTGLAAGYGLALLALPVAAGAVWRESDPRESVADVTELLFGLGGLALVGTLLLLDLAPLLWPVALLMVVSVCVGFGSANLYVILIASGRVRTARRTADLTAPLVAAFGLVLVELAFLAALKGWMAALGVQWGG